MTVLLAVPAALARVVARWLHRDQPPPPARTVLHWTTEETS